MEVISRKMGSSETNVWVSDGSGTFELAQTDGTYLGAERGTKIIMHLRPEHENFADASSVQKTVEKYSNFVQFPIKVNGSLLNVVQAIWSRSGSDISDIEYQNFYEHMSGVKEAYRFKLHYSVEVPMSVKALLYMPTSNKEKMTFSDAGCRLDLYCKKILISKGCQDLLPNYLRFVKGVVDCEDLPLNISRENYQDSALMARLRGVLTKRVLRMLQEKAKRDPVEYKNFYKEFSINIKEGLHMDADNKKALTDLIRFDSSFGDFIALGDYVSAMKPGQTQIYFFLSPDQRAANNSAYMEPFRKHDIPVLFLTVGVEELILQQMGQYEGKTFISIESPQMNIPDSLKSKDKISHEFTLPEDDRHNFCLWVRNELQPVVANVVVSDKLVDSPAMVSSMMTAAMRQMMSMMDEGFDQKMFSENLTMEVNPNHEMVVKLNMLRKRNVGAANSLVRHMLDNALMNAGIEFDMKKFLTRMNVFLMQLVDHELEGGAVGGIGSELGDNDNDGNGSESGSEDEVIEGEVEEKVGDEYQKVSPTHEEILSEALGQKSHTKYSSKN